VAFFIRAVSGAIRHSPFALSYWAIGLLGYSIVAKIEAPLFISHALEQTMLSALIGVLIVCVVGAICFWAIDKFVRDGRLANLLKLLVVLICLLAVLQRVLPLAGIYWL
jgi:hypothetical protein